MTKWTNTFLDAKRQLADPAADGLIARLVEESGPDEARRLFDLLIRRVEMPLDELPEMVRTFLEEQGQLPDWADPEQIRQAEALFLDHGPTFLIFLYFKSLPTLYTCANGAQVLYHTARLTHDRRGHEIFTRRIAETGQFLIDVMTEQGLAYNPFVASRSLLEGGTGVQTTLKVRLIHASIRYFLPADRWDEAAWGKPVNQEDLALTLMSFSVSTILGMEQFKLPYTPAQAEAYLHTWKVIGHLLGIDSDLLPQNLEDGKVLLARILERQSAPSEAGQALTQALIAFGEQAIPWKVFRNTPSILIRFLVGKETAGMLGVKTSLGCLSFLLPRVLLRALGLVEKLEDASGTANQLLARLSLDMVHHLVNYFNEYKDRPFRIPENMRKAWGIGENE